MEIIQRGVTVPPAAAPELRARKPFTFMELVFLFAAFLVYTLTAFKAGYWAGRDDGFFEIADAVRIRQRSVMMRRVKEPFDPKAKPKAAGAGFSETVPHVPGWEVVDNDAEEKYGGRK